MNKKIIFYFAAFMLFGCTNHESIYDPSILQQQAKENFPVKDVDPNQDWNMLASRTISVSVNETEGETYTVRVYNGNPFNSDADARVIAGQYIKLGI